MPRLECPAETCTHNQNKECVVERTYLKWRAAVDFPGKGTVLFFECGGYEGPQDRALNERE